MPAFDKKDVVCDYRAKRQWRPISGRITSLNKPVDVKVVRVTGSTEEEEKTKKRVIEDLALLETCSHENIAKVLGWVEWPSGLGVVMEQYQGGSLKQLLLNTAVDLPAALRFRMATDVAGALAFRPNLTVQNMVYGTIVPEHFSLTDRLVCKLCDLYTTTLDASSSSYSTEYVNYGMRFCAPEMVQQDMKTITDDPKSDTYTFGGIVYMFLVRQLPVYPTNNNKRLKACDAVQKWKMTFGEENVEMGATLEEIRERCLKIATERPEMVEIRDELQRRLKRESAKKIEEEVDKVVKQMNLDQPKTECAQPQPLHDGPANGLEEPDIQSTTAAAPEVDTSPTTLYNVSEGVRLRKSRQNLRLTTAKPLDPTTTVPNEDGSQQRKSSLPKTKDLLAVAIILFSIFFFLFRYLYYQL